MTTPEEWVALFAICLVLYGCWVIGFGAFMVLVGYVILYKVGTMINEKKRKDS